MQLLTYEEALVVESNPAHVRLFLFICQRLQEKNVDADEMAEKSDLFAAGLMGMLNENSSGYNRHEVAILFDHLMKWYITPYTDYGGKVQNRKDIRWHVDYSPDNDFAEILQAASAAIKEKRGPNGPKMPRSWGVGIKCSYSCDKGHAQFENSTVDHHGQLLKVEPWETFFQSENPADEAVALSLEPQMPWLMAYKFFYRTVARKCNLAAADAPAILATDNYYFGKYLYELEKDVSAELKYLVFRADSLTEDSYLAKDIVRGKRYAAREELLLALPSQTQFSHSAADMTTYCPLLGMLVGDIWYADFNCKFVLAAEQREAFALGFVEASVIAIVAEDRAFRSVVEFINVFFSIEEKPAVVQLLVKHLQRAEKTDDIADVIEKLQKSELIRMGPLAGWNFPLRNLHFGSAEKPALDVKVAATSTALQARVCETMGWTIADVEMLVGKKLWGFVQHLFASSRSTDLKLVDRVWLSAIDAQKNDLIALIYNQGYPILHEDDRMMDFSGYGDNRNPFANMLKNCPQLLVDSPRTDASLCPSKGDSRVAYGLWNMFRRTVIAAITDNIDDRHMLKYLQRCRALLDKLFPGDADIKNDFAREVRQKLGRYGRNEKELAILAGYWP